MTDRQRAEALWELLDDISTAGDMFKPDMNNAFVRYVLMRCEDRRKYFISRDGQTIEPVGEPQ